MAGEAQQRAGLHRLQGEHALFAEPLRPISRETSLGGEIEHLAADHAADARGAGERADQFDAHRRVRMGLGARQDVEGEGQEAVAGQNGGRLVEFLVRGRLAAAQIVIVHGGQIVMHQRIAVYAFERRADHQRLRAGNFEQAGGLHHQERPEPLAATKARIADRVHQARRTGGFARNRRRRQQPVEQIVDLLGGRSPGGSEKG